MKSKIFIFLVLFSIFYLLSPYFVFAVNYLPLVPCGISEEREREIKAKGEGDPNWDYSRPCTTCDFFRLIRNVMDLILLALAPAVGILFFVIAGFLILFGGEKPELIERGKKIFWNTFIALVIIFGAWMAVNTIIKSFGPDQIKESWWKFECKAAKEGPTISPPVSALCSNPVNLASQYQVPPSPTNAPELDTLISCIKQKLPGEDLGSILTYERANPLCNLTRGNPICGPCSHRVNSCHYGGATGTQGALAADFGNERIRDKIIKAALECGAKGAWCGIDGVKEFVDCSNPGVDLVHVTAKSCDRR